MGLSSPFSTLNDRVPAKIRARYRLRRIGWTFACIHTDVMKPHRRSIPSIVYPILLAAGVVGIVVTRREGESGARKLPEDLTGTLQKEVAAEQNPELDRFYQAFGYGPAWSARRPELVNTLMTADRHGLKPTDYLKAQSDVGLTKALMQYAGDLRYGRSNTGIYDKTERIPLGELALTVARDAAGLDAALRKLDPPFAEFRRLEGALPSATPEEHMRIESTMEQWRWMPRSFPNGAIVVNIPEFRLRAYDPDNNVALEMKTIVGLVRHQTPLFTADLKHVVFGAYWNGPTSILQNEIIPDILKDRGYLQRNDY